LAGDSRAQIATKALEAAKKAFESISKAAADDDKAKADEGASAKEAAKETALPKVQAGLDTGGREAVKNLRKTAHWVLGAFAAIGILVFGSLPFTDISGEGRDVWKIVAGLILASIGITMAIWAVSRVDEPEDASLGELHASLSGDSGWTTMPNPAGRVAWWMTPRQKALYKLKAELEGPEGKNHVGPMHPEIRASKTAIGRISGLIRSIGRTQDVRYRRAAEVAYRIVVRDVEVDALEARTAELTAAFERWAKAAALAKPATTSAGQGGNGDADDPADPT
jgi:hypothetical protein